MQTNPEPHSFAQDDEIDLMQIFEVIYNNKVLIGIITAVITVATAVVSLVMTPQFEAKSVIVPTSKPKEVGSGLEAVALQFGLTAPISPNLAEIVNILNSNTLYDRIIKKYNLLEVFFEKDKLANKTELEKYWMGIRLFKNDIVKVTTKQKEGLIELSVKYKDPQLASKFNQMILEELTEYMTSEARRVAETNKKYLEEQLVKVADPFIKAKIYTLIAQQIEIIMMSEVKENFAFKVLDYPLVPDKRVSPKRTQMVVIAFVSALILAIFVVFIKEYISSARAKKHTTTLQTNLNMEVK